MAFIQLKEQFMTSLAVDESNKIKPHRKVWEIKDNIKLFLLEAHLNQCSLLSQGFDEYMNLVLDDAEEVHMKTKNRKPLGKSTLHFDTCFINPFLCALLKR